MSNRNRRGAASGRVTNVAGNVSGNVIQAGNVRGTVRSVNIRGDLQGSVVIGDGLVMVDGVVIGTDEDDG